MNMDMAQLRAFEQVVRQGSFSKAARALDLSQPTVSLRIRALEEAVGGPLFHRRGHQVELTELGAAFMPHVQQALATLLRGVEVARESRDGARGRVRLGVLPSLAGGFLVAAVNRLQRAYPRLDLEVHTGHTDQVVEMLHDGFVKLGLIFWPFFSTDVVPLLRFREELLLVAHRDHPLAGRQVPAVQDLAAQADPLWRVDWTPEANHWQAQVSLPTARHLEVPIHMAHELVRGGYGVALLSRSLVDADLAEGRLVQVDVPAPSFARVSALVHSGREQSLSAAYAEVVRALREEGRHMLIR